MIYNVIMLSNSYIAFFKNLGGIAIFLFDFVLLTELCSSFFNVS